MKSAPSAYELQQDLDDLIAEVAGVTRPENLHIRPTVTPRVTVFPVDGYESWQERWVKGTGVTPKDWLIPTHWDKLHND